MKKGQTIRRGPFWVGPYKVQRPRARWQVWRWNGALLETFTRFPDAEAYAYKLEARDKSSRIEERRPGA